MEMVKETENKYVHYYCLTLDFTPAIETWTESSLLDGRTSPAKLKISPTFSSKRTPTLFTQMHYTR